MWNELDQETKNRLAVLNDEREIDGIEQGVARYRRSTQHQDIDRPSRRIIKAVLDKVSVAIAEDQRNLIDGKASGGRPQEWASAYLTMEPDKLALITLSCLMSIEDTKLSKSAFSIADRVKLEHEFDEIRSINRRRDKDSKGFARNFSDRLSDKTKVRQLYKRLADRPMSWTYNQRLGIGCRLIQQAVMATGLWGVDRRRDGKKTTMWVVMSDEIIELVLSAHSELEILRPVAQPMTCPPVPWTRSGKTITGGYHLIKQPIVRDKFGEHPVDYGTEGMDNVLRALNIIQDVEWTIDEDILRLVKTLEKNENNDIVPFVGAAPKLPVFPTGGTREQKRIWHQEKSQILAAFKAKASVRLAALKAIRCAESLVGMPLWFPHNLDWRGRIYPMPVYLSPQGPDMQKALLRFSRKKRLGAHGYMQLRLWAAGCAGQDKISIPDRYVWLHKEYPDPTKFDPYEDRRWMDYDSPLLFVQAMTELKNALLSGNASEYMTNVSVCVDGSQNGLQHLSAIGRDEIGGAAVNLINSEVPADLYADVSDLVYASVSGDAELVTATGQVKDEMGQPVPPLVWEPLLQNRKSRRGIVKRSVLAYPYGVTKAGMRDGLIVDGFTDGVDGSRHRNAWYLAEKIDESVRDVVISAGRLMDWFRKVAEDMARTNRPVAWTAPSGFPVSMHYFVREAKEVRTCLARISVQIPANQTDVSVAAQVRGIVANFIHSLDASHLVATALSMSDDHGVTDLHFVHDSYGTHACDVKKLDHVIRRTFVDMHSANPLHSFIASVKSAGYLPDDTPPQGSLDLNCVLESRFFFA